MRICSSVVAGELLLKDFEHVRNPWDRRGVGPRRLYVQEILDKQKSLLFLS